MQKERRIRRAKLRRRSITRKEPEAIHAGKETPGWLIRDQWSVYDQTIPAIARNNPDILRARGLHRLRPLTAQRRVAF